MLYIGLAIAVFIAIAWTYGRHWRASIVMMPPEVSIYRGEKSTKTAFIVYDGAFNVARVHWRQIRTDILLPQGDVYEVQYEWNRFDARVAVNRFLRTFIATGYDRVVVIGGSMGAILAARTIANDAFRTSCKDIVVIGVDPAVGAEALLPQMRTAAKLSTLLHTGPIWNFLLGWVTAVMFRSIPRDEMEHGINMRRLYEHVGHMREFKLSAIGDMNKTILAGYALADWQIPLSFKVGALFSAKDVVLDTEATRKQWQKLFGDSTNVSVPNGHHMDFIENPTAWKDAFKELFSKLDIIPESASR